MSQAPSSQAAADVSQPAAAVEAVQPAAAVAPWEEAEVLPWEVAVVPSVAVVAVDAFQAAFAFPSPSFSFLLPLLIGLERPE